MIKILLRASRLIRLIVLTTKGRLNLNDFTLQHFVSASVYNYELSKFAF